MHHFRQGGMREDGVHQVFLGGFKRLADHIALDQFGDFGPDHVGAQQLAGLGIEHGLDQPLGLAQGDGLAIADKRELADLDGISGLFRLGLGQTDGCDLRVAIGTARDGIGFDRMDVVLARDQFCHHDPFVAGLVRQPGRARDVADGIKPLDPGAAEFVRDHMGAVDFHTQLFEAQPFDIADDADGGNHGVKVVLFDLAAHFDMGRDLALGAVKLLDHRLLHDLHALLFKGLLGKGADLGVFDGQHAVHHFDDRGVSAQCVVKAGKFDADSARSDDQQFLGHPFRGQRRLVGPDQVAVGLETRQFAGAGAGGKDDGLGGDLFGALVGLDRDLALGGDRPLAHDHGHLVLFQQVPDAARQLPCDLARAFDHGVQIIADIVRLEPEFLGAVHQVEHFGRAQHRLCRDAAPVEADAAEMLAFDHAGAQPQLGRANCRHIATGAGANHHHVKGFRCHVTVLAKLVSELIYR